MLCHPVACNRPQLWSTNGIDRVRIPDVVAEEGIDPGFPRIFLDQAQELHVMWIFHMGEYPYLGYGSQVMKVTALLLFSAFSACQGRQSTPNTSLVNDDVNQAITDYLHAYYDALSAMEWEGYRDHFWKNATITTIWQQPGDSTASVDITPIDDFIKEAPPGLDSQAIFEERIEGVPIIYRQNIAQGWAGYSARFGSPDWLMQWSGTDALLRHDGEWKFVSVAFEVE